MTQGDFNERHPRTSDGKFTRSTAEEQNSGMDALTFRVQVADEDAELAASTLDYVAEQVDEGFTSGFYEGSWDFEQISSTTPRKRLNPDAKIEFTVEVSETSEERVADTLHRVADQIRLGMTSGFDNHDEGQYNFEQE